jgi:hypothetical protein
MTLAVALILLGLLMIYAGIKGLSIRQLLLGRIERRQFPEPASERIGGRR